MEKKKQVIDNSRVDEDLKGYPEVERMWTFGDKEVVVPKAARSSLFHGWKMRRDENVKIRHMWEMDPIAVPYAVSRNLLENAKIRRVYYNEGHILIIHHY